MQFLYNYAANLSEFDCLWLFCKMPKSKDIISSSGSESEEDEEVNLSIDFSDLKN